MRLPMTTCLFTLCGPCCPRPGLAGTPHLCAHFWAVPGCVPREREGHYPTVPPSVLGVCKGTVIPCEHDPGTSCSLTRRHGAGGPEALPTTPCSSHLGVGREGTFQKGTLGPPGWSKPGALSFISSTGPPWGQTCPGSSSQGANMGWICPGSSPPLSHVGGLTWTRPEQGPIRVRLTHKGPPQVTPTGGPTPLKTHIHQEGGPSSHTHRQGLSQALPTGLPTRMATPPEPSPCSGHCQGGD